MKQRKLANADKASLYFQTRSLKRDLGKSADNHRAGGINLSKLQSMPIPGSNFKYGFYADMEFDSRGQLDAVMESISIHDK
jgi:prephenate dehydratase